MTSTWLPGPTPAPVPTYTAQREWPDSAKPQFPNLSQKDFFLSCVLVKCGQDRLHLDNTLYYVNYSRRFMEHSEPSKNFGAAGITFYSSNVCIKHTLFSL